MEYRQKRQLTFVTVGLIFLMSGIEYAVILPTIWRYLQILEAPPYFLGLGLSAFSFSGLLFGPLFGHWSDRTRTTKNIILLANVFEIVGNFMYFMGYSKWLLLSSRIVAGIGAGAGSSIFGLLTRITSLENRATVFATVMACRQAGLLIGPAFNIFLRLCDFQLGPFIVNKYTSPGLFMSIVWGLLELVVLFMYWDLPPLDHGGQGMNMEEVEVEEEAQPLVTNEEAEDSEFRTFISTEQLEVQGVAGGPSPPPSPPSSPAHSLLLKDELPNPFLDFSARKEFLREEVLLLLAAQFVTLFNQTALETMVTPLTQKYFGFGELQNSMMYFLCGVEVIAGFLLVRGLSRCLADRLVLALGLAVCSISCAWCLVFLTDPRGGYPWQLAKFIMGVFLQLLGLPFLTVSQVSLFSKVTSAKTQGFSQGVRRSVGGLATILGPLWAGGLTENLHLMLGLMMALLVMVSVSVLIVCVCVIRTSRWGHPSSRRGKKEWLHWQNENHCLSAYTDTFKQNKRNLLNF
uniref:Major facilitator superfamily domain containing 8-like 2 n=1 Tax=Paramormyrops kingsleyae TaxID=1676925 RepID=A0A3B3QKH0_9TELE